MNGRLAPEDIMDNYNYYIEIQCNKCGKIYCFYPHRIMFSPECDCGNKNCGNSLCDWPNKNFGDFTLVKESIQQMYIETPFGNMYF